VEQAGIYRESLSTTEIIKYFCSPPFDNSGEAEIPRVECGKDDHVMERRAMRIGKGIMAPENPCPPPGHRIP